MFSVVAFAAEILPHPSMLRAWLEEFAGDDRVGLTVYQPNGDAAEIDAALDRAFAEFEPASQAWRRFVRTLVSPLAEEESLIAGSVAYYSFKRRPAPFDRLPRIGRGDFRTLRCLCGIFTDSSRDPEGPPDFIGVAAQKAGTTWWCELINRHPAVYRSPRFRKEARFFSVFRGFRPESVPVERYASLFPRPAGTVTGEWTPDYLWDPECAAMLGRAAPAAKLLVLLRDPVARYVSGLTHRVMYGEGLSAKADAMAFSGGLYGQQLEGLLKVFAREQVLVLQYERCCLDPAGELERTYRFLELPDPRFVPEGLTAPIHATDIEKVPLSIDRRDALVEAYRADSARLVELFPGVELDLWTSLGQERFPV